MKYILPFIFVICVGCLQKDDDRISCEDIIVSFTSLEAEYGCTDIRYQTEINLEDILQ